MKRIDKKYAIIYVDRDGESLHEDVDNFSPNKIQNDFYGQPEGSTLSWNLYLIIPEDLVPDKKLRKEIEENDKYTRKYIVPREKIDQFVEDYFPNIKRKRGKFKLITGASYKDACKKADIFWWRIYRNNSKKKQYGSEHDYDTIESYARELNDFDTLRKMDLLRADLIKNPDDKIIYVTHLTREFHYVQKKFSIFDKKLLKIKK